MRESIKKVGLRFEPSFTAGGIWNFITLVCAVFGAYYTLKGAQDNLNTRLTAIEDRRSKVDADHDAILEIRGDLKVLKALAEKVERRGDLLLLDPAPMQATGAPPAKPRG